MQRDKDSAPPPFIDYMATNVNICDASLAEAVYRIGPATVYTLYCGKRAFNDARSWIRNASHFQSNPFSPQVNVCIEPIAEPDEWVLEGNGKRVGSHGVRWG